MKDRTSWNIIDLLINDRGEEITDSQEIEFLVREFYIRFLGSCAHTLDALNREVMRRDDSLTQNECFSLARPFSVTDLDEALKSINIDKSLGIDGLNVFFFRQTWSIMKDDIWSTCVIFFDSCYLYRYLNSTAITLIPKRSNATHIKQFRLISCYDVLYKLISNMLVAIMHLVIPKVVILA